MFKINQKCKESGVVRPGLATFKSEKAANDHLTLLAELAAVCDRHKHFYNYEYEVVSIKKSKNKK